MEKLPVAFVFDQYLEHGAMIKGLRPATIKTYRESFRLIEIHSTAKFLDDLNAIALERVFLSASANRNWSPYTFFTHHKNLKAFFNWAVIRGLVKENPMLKVDRPRLPMSLPKALTEEQAIQILDAAYNIKWYIKSEGVRNRAVVAMFIFSGLRRKELCDLKRNDVDLENRKIFVMDGKWGRDRVVPMNSRLHCFLSIYAEQRDRRHKNGFHFFACLREHKPLGVSGIRRIFDRLRKATGIHVTPHMLRHTFGTLAYRGSKDILGVSASLGHSNLKTTQIYVQASADDIRNTVDAHPLNHR